MPFDLRDVVAMVKAMFICQSIVLRLGRALPALAVCLPLAAQQPSPDQARCVNEGFAFSLDEQISGCTAVLGSGRGTAANRAVAYYYRGLAHYDKRDYDRAIADYSEAIRLNPSEASAYNGRGNAYHDKREYDLAIADYTRAIEIDPKNAGYYDNRARIHLKTGRAAQGLPDAERALQLSPYDTSSLETRGHIFESLGRREEAIADFRRVLDINPDIQESRDALKRLGASP
jgi:tetratricopeptide (TPR) repeat protein